MKPDRHNYEELFILYWDNELPEDQKQEVEKFVSENPDLQEEFSLLGETRFRPESEIQYGYKNFLLNTGDASVNIPNYQEQLLSYIDNELANEQKKELEEFVSHHPAAQKELALLQKVKLEPEATIVYPDKSLLYRREERTPVIRMAWFRVAVAAAIILVAGLVTFRLTTRNPVNTAEGIAGTQKTNVSDTKKEELKPESNNVADNREVNNISTDKNSPQESLTSTSAGQPATASREKKSKNKPESNITDNSLIAQNEMTQNTSDETFYLVPVKSTNEAVVINDTDKKMNLFENTGVTERPSPTYTLYNESPKESGGLKEFLRKTTRMIERRTRIQTDDDNRLLVGAFAVSL
jgi:hypothetical protein